MKYVCVKDKSSSLSLMRLIACKYYKIIVILVDPARGHCYQGLTKPCESRGVRPRHTAQ